MGGIQSSMDALWDSKEANTVSNIVNPSRSIRMSTLSNPWSKKGGEEIKLYKWLHS